MKFHLRIINLAILASSQLLITNVSGTSTFGYACLENEVCKVRKKPSTIG